ncbi:MAG: RecQ family ATP-dependent DNA helicase [Treponema sp.]|nr:RecQ family ATP-dependent DNA helicase [Treponema sp.]MCL2251306.1 RecQ family ATP-dependent DNA helicase [Treponema sp.]
MIENDDETNANQDPLSEAVKSLFGLTYLFPYQRLVMTNILEAAHAAGIPIKWTVNVNQFDNQSETLTEEDEQSDRGMSGRQIVILPTGAGKSLCFQLPAMLIDGITLVIYPILSLMADQQRRLHERGFSPVTIRGGQTKEEREEIWRKLESGESKFIIANPEVLLTPQVKERLTKIKITHAVIDEAHCVSEWGESFRPSYLEIGSIIDSLNPPLVTAFTATASTPVLEKIKKYIFGDTEANLIVGNPDRPNISYSAMGCINRNLAVRDLLIANKRPAIVFCSSRPGTEKLARYLRNELAEMGFAWSGEIRFYHAGLSREEKAAAEKWLLKNTEAVLCSTCAFGMGVDKADVRTVIHRDCAPSVEAYLQESGRAGRDGEQSKAILLWGPEDENAMLRAKTDADKKRLSALLNYAKDTENCRRHSLLALLDFDSGGEVPEKLCCDICVSKESYLSDDAIGKLREEVSLLEFFRKNKRRFTQEKAASVLAKSETIRWSQDEASIAISFLIKIGKLKRIKFFLWKNKITLA